MKTIRTADPFTLQHPAEIMPEIDREMLYEISPSACLERGRDVDRVFMRREKHDFAVRHRLIQLPGNPKSFEKLEGEI